MDGFARPTRMASHGISVVGHRVVSRLVSFHAGTLGTLASGLLHPQTSDTGTHLLWGIVILLVVIGLTFTGSYKRLEKLQLLFVLLMLVAVTVSLFLINPEWGELLAGFVNVAPPDYPGWITEHPDISKRPVWVELSSYVGVIGGGRLRLPRLRHLLA